MYIKINKKFFHLSQHERIAHRRIYLILTRMIAFLNKFFKNFFLFILLCCGITINFSAYAAKSTTLLNVSYDPTRKLFEDYNELFNHYWQKKSNRTVEIKQSHGGSGTQARAVIDGLNADVVTLALAYDIDMISKKGKLLPLDWQKKLPNNSCPYTSIIVFVVKHGNPKHIQDWSDLIRPDIKVITPNPRTSGGARWNYLAAWGYALKKNSGNENAAKGFISKLYKNVPVLDTGARGSTTTFVQRGIGDVLLSWENEAFLIVNEFGKDRYEIVVPSMSILAEPPVAVVGHNTNKKGTTLIAHAYLEHLYAEEAQELIAKHYLRPTLSAVAMKYKKQFPEIKLLTIHEFGGWENVQKKHFDDGGMFDQIYKK